jgi:hypothetical protein
MNHDNDLRLHVSLIVGILLLLLVLLISPELLLQFDTTCLLHRLTKLNCPFCGMTRDFILIAKGHEPKFNLFSPIAFLFVFLAYPFFVILSFFKKRTIKLNQPMTHKIFFLTMLIMFVANNLK